MKFNIRDKIIIAYLVLIPLLWTTVKIAMAVTNSFTITATTTFTPLHTYFMAASGCNDANAGTSAGSPWCSPNHAVVCGDVIIAASGSYTPPITSFGAVSNCPSTSGGIDGNGGIYFAVLLCGGASVGDCAISNPNVDGFNVLGNNWAIEGWGVTGNGSDNLAFMSGQHAQTPGTQYHHIAFVNNISINQGQGFATGGNDATAAVPGTNVDYLAVVGSIAQNSANHSICLAAIDIVGPSNFDTKSGTHIFVDGNFAWSNVSSACLNVGDVEDFMADTLDGHGYSQQVVFSNNIGFHSYRYGLQFFYQAINPAAATIKAYNNTLYGNLTQGLGGFDGEINYNGGGNSTPWIMTTQKNIAMGSAAAGGKSNPIYALTIDNGTWTESTIGGTGVENILFGSATVDPGVPCNSGTAPFIACESGNSFGTNIYTNPTFTNTSDLISNRIGAPSCSGFETTTACLGWNAATGTLTTPSIISDLAAGCAQCSGKGYQKPTMNCASNSDFPAYLKGIVYLHWTGSIVQQKAGLSNVPCGM